MKRIALIGSTGSIGTSTLKIAKHLSDSVRITALAAGSNIDLLEQQARQFSPEIVALFDEKKAQELKKRLPHLNVVAGMEGVEAVASYSNADFVVSAMSGTMGLLPTIAAIKAGKKVGLANKEALVSGGALILDLVKKHKTKLLPIDSEHSAIFQCLQGEDPKKIRRLIITSSGGPFRSFSKEELTTISVEQALKHPTWNMGPKITIDSSTLMNKGLEVIEAHWLFDVPIDKIDVVIHPQSIIHSMVEFVDRSIMAQMGEPNMITPIQYAITYPERQEGLLTPFDFTKSHTLQFFPPDTDKFRCLSLAYEAVKSGGTMACYMNAANEVLVHRFLNKEISWSEIGSKLETLMERYTPEPILAVEEILATDRLARQEAARA